ncbi:hypothetical protein CEXT_738761 [Caerostris extrusa]|uniref:Uncharacterized protein n=1 Tax=Caerostris extrusa TaxID=172846 RepID=A0AAV4XV51_CAEEX|nr:hypothetical protein CEXT_738761 [Caerostris extrusa]
MDRINCMVICKDETCLDYLARMASLHENMQGMQNFDTSSSKPIECENGWPSSKRRTAADDPRKRQRNDAAHQSSRHGEGGESAALKFGRPTTDYGIEGRLRHPC